MDRGHLHCCSHDSRGMPIVWKVNDGESEKMEIVYQQVHAPVRVRVRVCMRVLLNTNEP